MYPINILNKHTSKDIPNAVNIMRPSPLGNPFKISKHFTRETAITQYAAWLNDKIVNEDVIVMRELRTIRKLQELADVNLVCCCVPQDCHGYVIRKILTEWSATNDFSLQGAER